MGPDLEINIKTRADLKGARELEASLKTQIASLKKLGQDASGAEAQLKKVQSSIKAAPIKSSIFTQAADGLRKIKEQGGAASSAITGFAGLVGAPFAAISAVAGSVALALAGATKAIHEFAEADDALNTLDAALAQNQILTEETRKKYQDLAGELQATTKIADDTWLRVLAQLTLYGSKPESVGMDVEAVKNLAALLGGGEGGVVAAANLWSKALNGNFGWLKRYNIVLDESTPKHERLNAVMGELAARAGGQLEARGKSLGGAILNLKNNVSDLMEETGQLLARFYRPVITGFESLVLVTTAVFQSINKLWPSHTQLKNATKATTQTTEEAAGALDTYTMKLESAVKAIQNLQRAQDEVNDAELAARLAVVDSAEARGSLSKEQAVRARYGLRQGAADAKLDNSVAANSATIRTLAGRLPGLEAGGKEDEARSIQQQIRDLDAANAQSIRLRNTGRFTDAMGAADDVFRTRKDGAGGGGAADAKAGFDLLGNVIEESLDKLVKRVTAKTTQLEKQIQNGGGR